MKNKITLIITVRNRDALRLERQIVSIIDQNVDPQIMIVDYGSKRIASGKIQSLLSKYHFKYIYVFSEGLPWNKCHAINIGVKNTNTPFIVTSDIDMLYSSDVFNYCIDNYTEKEIFHVETFWLNKKGNYEKAKYAGHGNCGGFVFTHKNAYLETGGYDERIVYWGKEDLDWPERLKKLGYKQKWLPAEHKLYHQWHKDESGVFFRPFTASYNTMKYCLENQFRPKIDIDWGANIAEKDRPILSLIHNNISCKTIKLRQNEMSRYNSIEKLVDTKTHGYLKLDLGLRYEAKVKSIVSKISKEIIRPVAFLCGYRVVEKINENFDYLYEMLPVLKQMGLIDYYISDDFRYIYLLWS